LHHARIRSTSTLERLFKELKRRMRVVGAFTNETSEATIAAEIALRSSEEWALQRYHTMDALQGNRDTKPATCETLTGRAPSIGS
jgi:putative transposase